jgi:Tol biopolymer transport system component
MSHQNLVRLCVRSPRRGMIGASAILMFMFALTCASATAASDETAEDTFPVSVTANGVYADMSTNQSLENPSITADGRYVAFRSAADNLGEQGPAGVNEAYVKDLDDGEVKLVSRANGVGGEPANEPGEGAGVENVIISGDGRYVVFTTDASNLVSGLPPAAEPGEHPLHVYRRDLQTGETILVDRVTGREGAILYERAPEAEGISEEGRYVLFRDHVEDLEDPAGEHEPGLSTVYVRDMQIGTTTAVSRAAGPAGELADEKSRAYSISPDGRYVAFQSAATNLVPGMEANAATQIYVRDLQTDTTTLISKTAATESAPAGEPGDESSEHSILVGNAGCEVAYESAATNIYLQEGKAPSTPQVYLTDACSTPLATTLVSRADGEDGAPAGEGNAVIPTPVGASADGRFILFAAFSELTGEVANSASTHLYLRDLESGQTTLLDRASGADGAPAFSNPEGGSISANGCRVAFVTASPNLTEPAPPLGNPLETYIRQLAPCQPPAREEHPEEPIAAGTTGGQTNASGQAATEAARATTTTPPSDDCVVPAMRALDLSAVKRQLNAAHCALGHIVHHYSTIIKGGLVEQSLHQGTVRPAGTRVNIWLSLGHHHGRRKRRRGH